jgi:hypothetical protein
MHIDSVATFAGLVEQIREIVERREVHDWPETDLAIRVPSGPVEMW